MSAPASTERAARAQQTEDDDGLLNLRAEQSLMRRALTHPLTRSTQVRSASAATPSHLGTSCAGSFRSSRPAGGSLLRQDVELTRFFRSTTRSYITTRLTQAKELGEAIVVNGKSASLPSPLSPLLIPPAARSDLCSDAGRRDPPWNPLEGLARSDGRLARARHPARKARVARGGRGGSPFPCFGIFVLVH